MDEYLLERWQELERLHQRIQDVLKTTDPSKASEQLQALELDLSAMVQRAQAEYVRF